MESSVRRSAFDASRTVVVKIGTNALSRPDDTWTSTGSAASPTSSFGCGRRVRRYSWSPAERLEPGSACWVSKSDPKNCRTCRPQPASVRPHLIGAYDAAFQRHGLRASQILLTANDFRRRARYLNMRNTIQYVVRVRRHPVVNENDTVSIDEIKFGDNDRLAAMVSSLLEATVSHHPVGD